MTAPTSLPLLAAHDHSLTFPINPHASPQKPSSTLNAISVPSLHDRLTYCTRLQFRRSPSGTCHNPALRGNWSDWSASSWVCRESPDLLPPAGSPYPIDSVYRTNPNINVLRSTGYQSTVPRPQHSRAGERQSTTSRSATAADSPRDTCRKASLATRRCSIAIRLLRDPPPLLPRLLLGVARKTNETRFRRCMSLDCSATRIKEPGGEQQRPGARSILVEHALQDPTPIPIPLPTPAPGPIPIPILLVLIPPEA
jgi:hypothetical protein